MQGFVLAKRVTLGVALLGVVLFRPGGPGEIAAQATQPAIQIEPEVLNLDTLSRQGAALLAKAKEANGTAAITLANYNGHYTMLTARTKSGGGELHGHFADFLFVIAGDGTEMTGGTLLNPKVLPDGEVRGTGIEGGAAHVLHAGDVIHIPAGTPHQSIEAPGQTIIIYVIKVREPDLKL